MSRPLNTAVNATPAKWPQDVWDRWERRVVPLFSGDEWCDYANYHTHPETGKSGFVYTLMPGQHVCFVNFIQEQ